MKWASVKIEALRNGSRHSLVGGPFGSDLTTRDYVDEGVPVVRGVNLPDDRQFNDADFVFVSEEKAEALAANNARPGDVVFTQRGTLGQVGLIPSDCRFPRYLISQSQMKLTVDEAKANAKFVFYYFRHPSTVQKIKNHAITSGVPHINLGILRDFQIPLPPLPAQNRIVETLSAYDDLIENNRRRMALLEESARLLYQEWFVRLRFPGHEHVRITNGVPKGWDAGVIEDFYKTASGGTPSRTVPEYFTGDIPWVKTQELPNGFILNTNEKITEDAVKHSSAKIFPNRTLLVALYGATVGEVGILSMDAATNQACCAVMPADDRAHFVHSFLFFRENKPQLMALSAGAAQNNISQQIIREYKMVMPPKSLMNVFIGALEPVFGQSLNLARQNEKLRAARDLLLPRLMSGELAV